MILLEIMFRVIRMKKELGQKILPLSVLSVGGKCKYEDFTISIRGVGPGRIKKFLRNLEK